jgi:hypothetical protein
MKSPRKIDRGYASQRAADASSWPASGFADDRGFGAVFDSSGEALLVVDPTGRILKANSRGREFLRLGEQPSSGKAYLRDCVLQLPGEPLAEIWSPPSRFLISQCFALDGFSDPHHASLDFAGVPFASLFGRGLAGAKGRSQMAAGRGGASRSARIGSYGHHFV